MKDNDPVYSETSLKLAKHLYRCAIIAERLLNFAESDLADLATSGTGKKARQWAQEGIAAARLIGVSDPEAFRIGGLLPQKSCSARVRRKRP